MRVELRGVSRRYGETRALHDVDLRVADEVRVLAIIGPSGGGKSTLLRLMGGLEIPDSGEVVIEGNVLGQDEARLLAHRRSNGFLFQAFNLFPHFTALRNVVVPLIKVHGMKKTEAEALGREQLKRFGLSGHEHKTPAQLSGGQQQRVGLARAIAIRPKLLLLDEPTSALDPEMTAEVLEVIEDLCREGQEIVLSTHEMGFARALADDVVFLSEGELIEHGPAEQVFGDARDERVRRFLGRVMKW